MRPPLLLHRRHVVLDTAAGACLVDGVRRSAQSGHWMFYLPATGEKFFHARDGCIDCIHASRPLDGDLDRSWSNGTYTNLDWRAALNTPIERRLAELWVASDRLAAARLGPAPLGLTFADRFVRDGVELGPTAGLIVEDAGRLPAKAPCTDAAMIAAGVRPDRIRSAIRQQHNGYVIDLSSVVGVQPIDAEAEVESALGRIRRAVRVAACA